MREKNAEAKYWWLLMRRHNFPRLTENKHVKLTALMAENFQLQIIHAANRHYCASCASCSHVIREKCKMKNEEDRLLSSANIDFTIMTRANGIARRHITSFASVFLFFAAWRKCTPELPISEAIYFVLVFLFRRAYRGLIWRHSGSSEAARQGGQRQSKSILRQNVNNVRLTQFICLPAQCVVCEKCSTCSRVYPLFV